METALTTLIFSDCRPNRPNGKHSGDLPKSLKLHLDPGDMEASGSLSHKVLYSGGFKAPCTKSAVN